MLSDTERHIYDLHTRQSVSLRECAERLGITYTTVRIHYWRAQQRLQGVLRPSRGGKVKRMERDAGWMERQVSYLLTLPHEHACRYLNGIQLVWGMAVRNEVEEAVEARR